MRAEVARPVQRQSGQTRQVRERYRLHRVLSVDTCVGLCCVHLLDLGAP
jgi:hypothetical protein